MEQITIVTIIAVTILTRLTAIIIGVYVSVDYFGVASFRALNRQVSPFIGRNFSVFFF